MALLARDTFQLYQRVRPTAEAMTKGLYRASDRGIVRGFSRDADGLRLQLNDACTMRRSAWWWWEPDETARPDTRRRGFTSMTARFYVDQRVHPTAAAMAKGIVPSARGIVVGFSPSGWDVTVRVNGARPRRYDASWWEPDEPATADTRRARARAARRS
jgi:hypothetical protein